MAAGARYVRTVPSSPAEASSHGSAGFQATAFTQPLWPSRHCSCWPERELQMYSLPSSAPQATNPLRAPPMHDLRAGKGGQGDARLEAGS